MRDARAPTRLRISLQKLARTVFGSNNIAASAGLSRSAGPPTRPRSPPSGSSTATERARTWRQADAILVIGSNLTESNPVLSLAVIKAMRKGKTVIVVDPRTTELARRATIPSGAQARVRTSVRAAGHLGAYPRR